jgi:hypothetical protein
MSKKRQSRKSSKKYSPKETSVGAEVVTTNKRSARAKDFNPDYSQTIKDLKRIGVLAGTFITALVILSFFLR